MLLCRLPRALAPAPCQASIRQHSTDHVVVGREDQKEGFAHHGSRAAQCRSHRVGTGSCCRHAPAHVSFQRIRRVQSAGVIALPRNNIPTAREAVRSIWNGEVPDYGAVDTSASAGQVLTGLVSAALDIVAYRQISMKPDSIHLVSSDRTSYLKFGASIERMADTAVILSHILAANAEESSDLGDLMVRTPPFRSLRVVILSSDGDCAINRLDLDPESLGGVSWYGPFNGERFNEIAQGFALFVTHMVANVFVGDDGTETFDESFEWIS